MDHVRKFFFILFLSILFSVQSYGQRDPISVYGYFDLVGRDFFEREFPNGAKENPPPTFILLRTHILLNSQFARNWRILRQGCHLRIMRRQPEWFF